MCGTLAALSADQAGDPVCPPRVGGARPDQAVKRPLSLHKVIPYIHFEWLGFLELDDLLRLAASNQKWAAIVLGNESVWRRIEIPTRFRGSMTNDTLEAVLAKVDASQRTTWLSVEGCHELKMERFRSLVCRFRARETVKSPFCPDSLMGITQECATCGRERCPDWVW